MNRRKYILMSGLILAFLAVYAVSLPAAGQANTGAAIVRAKIVKRLGVARFVRNLNITPDQKTRIKGILQANKTQIQRAVRDTVKGHLDMINGTFYCTTAKCSLKEADT